MSSIIVIISHMPKQYILARCGCDISITIDCIKLFEFTPLVNTTGYYLLVMTLFREQ